MKRLVLLLTCALAASAQAQPEITLKPESGKVIIRAGDAPLATFVYRDPKIPRPYFAHLHAPGGVQVTRNHPPITGKDATDHAELHPGLWLAFGNLNGADFWRNKAWVRQEKYLGSSGEGRAVLGANNLYLANDKNTVVCREKARYTIVILPVGHLLLWDSEFRSDKADLSFGDQEEMGLGIRVATGLTVKGGGQILTSEGHQNEKQVRGKTSPWCDYSGQLGGRHAGVLLMQHPQNFRPAWYHARDYGLLVANPFGRNALTGGPMSQVVVKQGESLRLRYGILLHARSDATKLDRSAAYKTYLHEAGK